MRVWSALVIVLASGCNQILGIGDVTAASAADHDAAPGDGTPADGRPDAGADAQVGPFTVYAHSDHVLYKIDLSASTLVTVGPFNAPMVNNMEDVITDLAVAPNGTIYGVSETALYAADPTNGHVTTIGSITMCGASTVALTTTPEGRIWAGDYMGAICEIDLSSGAPVVKAPVAMQGGLALSGDMVGVGNGTVFGTAYRTTDPVGTGTQLDNLLVTVNVETGAAVQVGTGTGFPKLFGLAYANGKIFGFLHDGTGRVVTIDPASGVGTLFGTFVDPATSKGISFAGAGVSSLVAPN
jgi:hypothetical protein